MRGLLVFAIPGLLALASEAHSGEIRSDEAAAKVCRRVAEWKPTGVATASEADAKQFAGEAFCADLLYRMENDEYNPAKARRCCLVKKDCNRELAVIFANGLGVRRDYDAATYFLCHASEEMAPAELWGMLGHLEEMRSGSDTKDLDFCDYATSGRGQLFCEQLAGSRQAEQDEKRIDAVRKTLNETAGEKLKVLIAAADQFGQDEGGFLGESSRGGTAYPAMVVEAQNEAESGFVDALEAHSKSRAPRASADELASADRTLNTVYRKLIKSMKACPTCGEDSGEAVRETLRAAQRSWVKYRDAWTAYYVARWAGAAPAEALEREITTALTLKRAELLRKQID